MNCPECGKQMKQVNTRRHPCFECHNPKCDVIDVIKRCKGHNHFKIFDIIHRRASV